MLLLNLLILNGFQVLFFWGGDSFETLACTVDVICESENLSRKDPVLISNFQTQI